MPDWGTRADPTKGAHDGGARRARRRAVVWSIATAAAFALALGVADLFA